MITELLKLATGTFKANLADTVQRAVSKAVLLLIAGIAGAVALGFLTAAGYYALRYRFTAPEAQVLVALIYLVVAGIFVFAAQRAGKMNPAKRASLSVSSVLPAVMESAEQAMRGTRHTAASAFSAPPETMTEKAQRVAEDQVRKLPPYQRLSAALITGYLLGRVLDRRLDKR